MIRLSKDKVLELHRLICDETGGDPGIRDTALLESALESPFLTFGGIDLYPTLEEKGARLGFSLISNHAFVDGNKRIGIFALLVFLRVNGVPLALTNEDIITAALGVAAGNMDYPALLDWVLVHRTN